MAQPVVTSPAPSPTPLPVKLEREPSPVPSMEINQEDETQQLAIVPVDVTPSETLQSQSPPQSAVSPPPIPHFIDSINELRQFSDALSAFYRCYDDLQSHIYSVESAIDSQLNLQAPKITSQPEEILPIATVNEPTSAPPSIPITENENEKETSKPQQSELEFLCLTMSSRGLRRYMLTNLGEANKLREEVPKALKVSSNPAKLILESVGRFYLQGSKAYTKDSPMITAREASVLTLECFLLAQDDDGVVKMDKEIKEESGKAAIAWRKRLIVEGGLANACEIDARGLLMFIGCFGIPQFFKNEDFKDLIRAGNVKEISSVLKRSSVLATKISDLIDSTMKMRMAVEAVDIAYSSGFEDKLPQHPVLPSFLRDAKELWKKSKRLSQGSYHAVNEANKKYLSAFLSVMKCLERHNIDPSKALPGWKINEKIIALEKDIVNFDKKIREQMLNKRRADDMYLRNQEAKRFRYVDPGLPQHQLPAHLDSQRRFLDSVHGPSIRALTSPPLMHGTGVGHGMLEAEASDRRATYTGYYGEEVADTAGQAGSYGGQHYGLRGDGAYSDRLADAGHTYAGQPPAYGLATFDGAYNERLAATGHTYAGQPPAYGLASIYRPPPSVEEFPGKTAGVASRTTGSDLYQFADTVVDSETYHSTGAQAAAAGPSVVPAHQSSYLY
ncbi:OLC1v1014475C1 [Oldenlandia corymbosa var. corymbosa]|uniref:FRIGIDA-like protein n=1 Tax=Oldenlandia corymbosa var. corymbosa TaxID=529605 RepID=A0AAV1E0X2_OLDCO|nr:OLC1v1014475C1 [Oldenlandia corymbosa var. corymbosa]